ncbi:MAG: AAC(3) family N-acetyltransferase [Anaerolineae bacterium]|nr:AAC(3) family N-acetyltransferase [Anaerolineae bacterium]
MTRPESPDPTVGLTQAQIEADLRRLGLKQGDIVEVHSSLSSLGPVAGGAETVVDALMAVVGQEGGLVMSAYPVSKLLPLTDEERARGITAKVRLYDETYDGPTGMGAIADAFRARPDTVLGQGFHRVCAWGREAEALSTGYQVLLELDGWVLLLGVGIGYVSSMHQAEHVGIPDEVAATVRVPDEIRRDYPDDIYISYSAPPEDGWAKVRDEAGRRGLIRHGRVGAAACMLFRARPVVAIYEQALRTDPLGLFGVKKG